MIILPEIKLQQIIDYYLDFVRADYVAYQNDETKSYLYKIFGTNQTGNYNFFQQAKAILITTKDSPKNLETRLIYDRTRASVPSIFITVPSDNPIGDGVSIDTGYGGIEFDDIDSTFQETLTRTYNTKFNLMITSSNSFEVITIHYLLKSLIISIGRLLDINGFRKWSLNSGELMMQSDITPHVYNRSLFFNCMYEMTVPDIEENQFVKEIDFNAYIQDIEAVASTINIINNIYYLYANSNVIR